MEPEKRGPYGAAVGYFGFQGNMDTAIPIRTIVMKDGIAYLQAGGGVVYDSDPESEWQETENKLAAPARAIAIAEGRADVILLIDNYDSFTYNLYQYLSELGADVHVVRNDAVSLEDIEESEAGEDRCLAGTVHPAGGWNIQ